LSSLALAALLLACAHSLAHADAIVRVDPPSWWTGFAVPELQLTVHGPDVAALTPSIDFPGVRLATVTRTESANYLFLTLEIAPDASPGRVPIVFRRDGAVVATHDYELKARRPGSRERTGFDGASAIYLLMPDRFASADPSNDAPAGSLDRVDRSGRDARHGGDLAGVTKSLDYVRGLGFTHVWLTPPLENAQPEYSYHGYAITDHYRIDPRYGTNEDYVALSRAARERGMGLIWDVVVNHVGDRHWWYRDPPAADWFNLPRDKTITNHVHSTVQDPYAAPADRELFARGWFDGHMPDLNQRNPLLATYLIQNVLWWIEYADLGGLRIDTYPYSNREFMAAFSMRVMQEYPRFNMVGEEWHSDPAIVSYWQAGKVNADGYVSYVPSLMDFPLQKALVDALVVPESLHVGFKNLYERISTDFLYANPRNLVVFGDNHDFDRLYVQLNRDDALVRMALTFIATMRGIPQLFYGTEVNMANDRPHDHGDIRRDMPGGWPGDRADAFTGRGLSAEQAATQEFVRTLFNWRRQSAAVTSGTLRHYTPRDGTYVYFRHAPGETAMVVLNKSTKPVPLDLARFRGDLPANASARDVLAGRDVTLGDRWTAPPRSATVFEIRTPTSGPAASGP
jgi:glycosidase